MTTSTRLWLVRHGQSLWNAQGRVQGQSGTGLSPLGHRQAGAAAKWLAATIDHASVVSSDLTRAHETAIPIAAALGVDVELDPAVRERSFGSWEGQTPAELDARGDGLWQQWMRVAASPVHGNDVVTRVGGESDTALVQRVVPALRAHAGRAADRGADVVVVTHGGTIWHGLHGLLDLPPLTLGAVGNASIATLLFADDRVFLDQYNSQAHIAPEERTTFRPRESGAGED